MNNAIVFALVAISTSANVFATQKSDCFPSANNPCIFSNHEGVVSYVDEGYLELCKNAESIKNACREIDLNLELKTKAEQRAILAAAAAKEQSDKAKAELRAKKDL